MSDVRKDVTDNEVEPNETDEKVDKKAYLKVSQDMHKYKSEKEALRAERDKLKADQEARETATLKEQEKWADLYKKAEAKLEQTKLERDAEKNRFMEFHKVQSVVSQLGGFKKSEYNKFIDTSKIVTDENGGVDEESVKAEVARIKKEYPELIKVSAGTADLPNAAPKSGTNVEKPYSSLTPEEKQQLKMKLFMEKESKNKQ